MTGTNNSNQLSRVVWVQTVLVPLITNNSVVILMRYTNARGVSWGRAEGVAVTPPQRPEINTKLQGNFWIVQ